MMMMKKKKKSWMIDETGDFLVVQLFAWFVLSCLVFSPASQPARFGHPQQTKNNNTHSPGFGKNSAKKV